MPKLSLDGSIEENVITALCHNDRLALTVVQKVTSDLFSTRIMREIAETAIPYIEKYREPPGPHLRDLKEGLLRRTTEDGRYANLIVDKMERLAPDLNEAYVLAELDNFVGLRQASMAVDTMSKAVENGNLTAARAEAWTIVNTRPPGTQLGNPFGEPQPPPFDPTILPRALRDFVIDRAEATGFDPAAIAWTAISACSAALDGSIRLEILPGFDVPPGIWVLLFGDSGIGKSPIQKIGFGPLKKLEDEWAADSKIEHEQWEAEDKEKRGKEPVRVRLYTTNASVEALQNILAKQDRGIAALPEEFSDLIGQFDKYNANKGGLLDRGFYKSLHDGGPHNIDRVSRGNARIANAHGVVCSGIQPDALRKLGDLTSDGLLQRCNVIIMRPQQSYDEDNYGVRRAVVAYEGLIQRLANVRGDKVVKLSLQARLVHKRVREGLKPYQNKHLGGGFKSYCDKLLGQWARLCLVLGHIVDEPEDVAEIDQSTAELAETLVFDNLLLHAARFYSWTGGSDYPEATKTIRSFLLSRQRARVVASDLKSGAHGCRHMGIKQLNDAVSPLITDGWLEPEGHYDTRAWRVNAAIYTEFAEQAEIAKYEKAQLRELIDESVERRRAERRRDDHEIPSSAREAYTEKEEQRANGKILPRTQKTESHVSTQNGNHASRPKFKYLPRPDKEWLARMEPSGE